MRNTFTISISEIYGSTANTREAAIAIFKGLPNTENLTIIVDFINVDFISRSFAESLFEIRKELISTIGDLVFQINNANESVFMILNAVEKTQNKPDRQVSKFKIYNFPEPKLFEQYLLSI